MKRILITGANGLVGSHFVENYLGSNNEYSLLTPDREELDITDNLSVGKYINNNTPDVVINFAAYTDVTKAEDERNNKEGQCWIINVEGTNNLINNIDKNTYFIHISTDTVFSGNKNAPGPYEENHLQEENSEMVSWYGWTKREAEKNVVKKLSNSVILRISNPTRARYEQKLDYVRKILHLFDTGKIYPMFDDQYLTLTYVDEVTQTLKVLIEKRNRGIFHVSSINLFTPHKLANLLIEKARGKKNAIKSISIEDFLKDNPARYPQYGGLKVEKTMVELGLQFNTWEKTIDALVRQLSA